MLGQKVAVGASRLFFNSQTSLVLDQTDLFGLWRIGLDKVSVIAPLLDEYRQFYAQNSDVKLALDFLSARISQNQSVVFAVSCGQDFVGFTQLYPGFSSVSAQAIWTLNDLYVQQKYRGQGVGSLLLNQASAFARQTEAKGVFLQTAPNNTRAQKLYESMGYKQDGYLGYFLTV
ncbi:MAG: GNAT family N-acetyltransferase [Paraglaciecola sp.]|nr:GNAT family N-acetyltransferase [Paraglaciecola sp.]